MTISMPGPVGGGIVRLTRIMAPPVGGGEEIDWGLLAAEGSRFPGDYHQFVAVYGGGDIDDILGISTPPVPGSIACMEFLTP